MERGLQRRSKIKSVTHTLIECLQNIESIQNNEVLILLWLGDKFHERSNFRNNLSQSMKSVKKIEGLGDFKWESQAVRKDTNHPGKVKNDVMLN